ncbi:hypothetical protein D3Z53_02105 [Lachnospiraceae bacterium]|nr:hypothetical protein [uncultured Schaedlerella sp.]NBI56882.1 hypothetical protein [Lachnospiraceae bacterium]
MDIQKTVKEIGLFETAINLAKVSSSADVIQKVGASMPLPNDDIVNRVGQVAKWLLDFGKSNYMFLTPEIALIEEMSKLVDSHMEIIIAIPCNLEQEAKERLKNNLPHGIVVTVLEEPYFPQSFFPGNGMLVICGYWAGNRALVLSDTYRMVEHYSGFLGKKVFVPYEELDAATRYEGWMEINQQRISTKWRCES